MIYVAVSGDYESMRIDGLYATREAAQRKADRIRSLKHPEPKP